VRQSGGAARRIPNADNATAIRNAVKLAFNSAAALAGNALSAPLAKGAGFASFSPKNSPAPGGLASLLDPCS
jgi:hypothetical protein